MAEFPSITFSASSEHPKNKTLILLLAEGELTSPAFKKLDEQSSGTLTRAVSIAAFKAKKKTALEILAPHGLDQDRLLLIGVGKQAGLSERDWLEIGGFLRGKLSPKVEKADVIFDACEDEAGHAPQWLVQGFSLKNYSFKTYKSKKDKNADEDADQAKDDEKTVSLTVFCKVAAEAETKFIATRALDEGVYLARDLVNEPANILTPPEFAARLQALEAQGLAVEVLDEQKLQALGMRALLAVGQGSAQPSQVVVLRWNGAAAEEDSSSEGALVLVGKGVCFDSGGISIKPGPGMEDMKGDMAGAAAVAGTLLTLAKEKAPVNVVGIVGLVENMPSGTAQRPGDIVTAASGQTIEVLNTDAEGRMVLADLLWYAQTHLGAKSMITLATLTGAILVALGKENAGLFTNSDALARELTEAGLETGETVWRLPLSKKYNKLIDSKTADMKNIGGRDAGSITAAQFLQRFVQSGNSWAHLDIAGTAIASPTNDINPSWGSGFGVRLLERFLTRFHGK